MRLVALVLLVAALAGRCAPEPPEPPVGPVPSNYLTEKANCDKQGGRWGQGGKSGFFVCYLTTRDAGKACRREGDCEGQCLARSQTCAPVTPLFGCQDVLGADGSRSTICRD